jgi:rhodanese-related sulfurtransferase
MKKIICCLLVSVFLVLIVGCGTKETTSEKSELDKVIESGKYQIVDVRTSSEYNEGHVKGAINIPYDTIDSDTKLDKDKTIIVYCKSGVRSKKAATTLTELGYKVLDLGAYSSINLEKE